MPKKLTGLTQQEEVLLACAARGDWWTPEKIGEKNPDMNPYFGSRWTARRTIRATVIYHLLTGSIWPGETHPWPMTKKGLMIRGAKISGFLDLEGEKLSTTVWMHSCKFEMQLDFMAAETLTMSFSCSYFAEGINAERAFVDGALNLPDCVLRNADGVSFHGTGLRVTQDLFIRDAARSFGEILLQGASVEGQVELGGHFRNKGGIVINASGAKFGDLHFKNFVASGQVRLRSARILGQLSFSSGCILNGDDTAFDAHAISVDEDAFFRKLSCRGGIDLARSWFGGNLAIDDVYLKNPDNVALSLTLAVSEAGLLFDYSSVKDRKRRVGIEGVVVLDQVKCKTFSDSSQFWPSKGFVSLNGFTYERFQDCDCSWQMRRDWLNLQHASDLGRVQGSVFNPQPWVQACQVLRNMGYERDAKELAICREEALSRRVDNPYYAWAWAQLLRVTIGFGYKPGRAFYWCLLLFLGGWAVFATAANLGYMAPRDGDVQTFLASDKKNRLPEHYNRFNAIIFSLDSFIPIVELGQDEAWQPSDIQTGYRRDPHDGWFAQMVRMALGHDWTVTGEPDTPVIVSDSIWGQAAAFIAWLFHRGAHRVVYWSWAVLGWLFVSLYIAGMSGIMKKE